MPSRSTASGAWLSRRAAAPARQVWNRVMTSPPPGMDGRRARTLRRASAINDRGQVVGWATNPDGARQRGFFIDLRSGRVRHVGGDGQSRVHAINSRGQAVGMREAHPFGFHALLWDLDRDVLVNLNDRLPPGQRWPTDWPQTRSGWNLREAWGINDQAQIVGDGTHLIEGQPFAHALRLTRSGGAPCRYDRRLTPSATAVRLLRPARFSCGTGAVPAERRALIVPLGRERFQQPRRRHAVGVPPIEDRFHQIRREQRRSEQCAEAAPLERLGGGHLADRGVAALLEKLPTPEHPRRRLHHRRIGARRHGILAALPHGRHHRVPPRPPPDRRRHADRGAGRLGHAAALGASGAMAVRSRARSAKPPPPLMPLSMVDSACAAGLAEAARSSAPCAAPRY